MTTALVVLAYAGVPPSVRFPASVAMIAWTAWILTTSRLASNPLVPFFGMWLISFSVRFGGMIEFADDSGQAVPMAFLMVFLALVLLGYALAPDTPSLRRRAPVPPGYATPLSTLAQDLFRFRHLLDLAALAGYVAAISFATEMITYNHVNVMDPSSTREVFQVERVVTPLTYLTLLARSGGIIAFITGIIGWQWLSKTKTAVYIGSGLSIVVLSIVTAGRFIVLEVLMAGLFAIAAKRTLGLPVFRGKRYAYAAVGSVVVVVLYIFAISIYRSDFSPDRNEQYMLATMHGDVSRELKDTWFSAMPVEARSSLISAYANIGGPVQNFAVFWKVHSAPLSWGSLQFSIVSRNLKRVFPSVVSADEVLEMSAAEFKAVGEGGASWQTGVRDIIVDFGQVGAVWGALLLGATIAFLNARFCDEASLATILPLCGIWIVCFHFTMYSIIGEPAVVALLACGLLPRSSGGRS
ncbi:MAG: hypothetical protein ABSF98_01480 [Bryobacteraceae bacterium]